MAKKTGWMGDGEPGWFATLIGGAVLIVGGFSLGLVVGVVSEEPELVVGHLVGRSEQVVWSGGVQDSALALEPIPAGGTGSETGATGSEAEVAGTTTGSLPRRRRKKGRRYLYAATKPYPRTLRRGSAISRPIG